MQSFKKAASLARWSAGSEVQSNIVNYLQAGQGRRNNADANDAFLSKLAGAEARDEQVKAAPKPIIAPSGDETRREIAAAKEAALRQREEAIHRTKGQRRLSAVEIAAASDIFWEHDRDASATIDKEEWVGMMQDVARRTGRPAFAPQELDRAFAEADVDGSGSIDLHEWVQAQGAALDSSGVIKSQPTASTGPRVSGGGAGKAPATASNGPSSEGVRGSGISRNSVQQTSLADVLKPSQCLPTCGARLPPLSPNTLYLLLPRCYSCPSPTLSHLACAPLSRLPSQPRQVPLKGALCSSQPACTRPTFRQEQTPTTQMTKRAATCAHTAAIKPASHRGYWGLPPVSHSAACCHERHL